MSKSFTWEQCRMMIGEFNEERRGYFWIVYGKGKGKQYTARQKKYAYEQIGIFGIRATARILQVPRRTLQRWCRDYDWQVSRCPGWVYGWAERRRKRREFWERRGYSY